MLFGLQLGSEKLDTLRYIESHSKFYLNETRQDENEIWTNGTDAKTRRDFQRDEIFNETRQQIISVPPKLSMKSL